MAEPPHVAVLIETSREYGRGLLRGVARYVREHGPWSIYFRPQGLEQPVPAWLSDWHGDGILARIDNRKTARGLLAVGLPAVDLRGAIADLGLPFIGVDNRSVAKLALDHLLDRGFRRFGFCGTRRGENRFLDARCDYFKTLVEQAGYSCSVFQVCGGRRRKPAWEQQQKQIAAWLADLPKPVGVMTCNDDRGQQVLDAAQRGRMLVPDEVAVVSVDNDEHLCSLSNPPLTSIDVNPGRIGYEAAALLGRLMAGEEASEEPVYLSPSGIITRQSTDVLAIDDRLVAMGVRFIREHACDGLSVKQVVDHLDISRSTLERRFKKWLRRTPKAEIIRVQFDRAKQLLADSELPLLIVAQKSGFGSIHYFTDLFHKKVGITPGAYRDRSKTVN